MLLKTFDGIFCSKLVAVLERIVMVHSVKEDIKLLHTKFQLDRFALLFLVVKTNVKTANFNKF